MKRMFILSLTLIMACACGGGSTVANQCATNDDCISGYLCINQSCQAGEPVTIVTDKLPDAYVEAEYSFTLQADKGAPPYSWTLLEGPNWMSINNQTGTLKGTPLQKSDGLTVKVKVSDSTSGRDSSAEASFTLIVQPCQDGQKVICHEVAGGVCMVGKKTCASGQWGECKDLDFSIDKEFCGSDCGSCPAETADRCKQGMCVCGPQAVTCAEKELCCSGECKSTDSADNCGGCGRVCADILPHTANTRCENGSCVSDGCAAGYIDCDDNPFNGCDTEISITNCGECGKDCTGQVEHVQQIECQADSGSYACGYSGQGNLGEGCVLGYLDCDGNRANGCEAQVNKENCGACGLNCPASCKLDEDLQRYICTCDTDVECGDGFICCNHVCTSAWDIHNCGSCGNDCATLVQHAPALCSQGACTHGNCEHGWLDCDNKVANGCETPFSVSNCGSCGNNCGSNTACDDGNCVCVENYGNCLDGWTDGCETNLTNTAAHCGQCGHDCSQEVQHVQHPLCQNSHCDYDACLSQYGDCDSMRGNGCEEDLWQTAACGTNCSDRKNCNAEIQNAANPTCNQGSCDFQSCLSGYDSCDSNRANGCEENIWELTDCGTSCSNRVNCDNTVQNATGKKCNTGLCDYQSCNNGFGNCDTIRTNGCEENIWELTDCGTSCTNRVNCNNTVQNASGKTCASGTCNYSQCNSGYGDCDTNRANGCEISLWTTTSCRIDCSQNGVNCNTQVVNASGVYCNQGLCDYSSCNPTSYGDCDNYRTNGCETNLWQTAACGTTCQNLVSCNATVQHATGLYCNQGSCDYGQCQSPYADCDTVRSNGCESNLTNDTLHCGSCSINCNNTVQHATGIYCSSSLCNYNQCSSAQYADCNSNRADGCETNLYQNSSCGTTCTNRINCTALPHTRNQYCFNGQCIYSCLDNWYDCDTSITNGCERNSPCP